MQFKIFSKVLTLEVNNDSVLLDQKSLTLLIELEKEVQNFTLDKPSAKIKWHQSTGTITKLFMQSIGIPFSHLTAIVYW